MSIKNKNREGKRSLIFGKYEAGHIVDDAMKWWDSTGRIAMKYRQFSGDTKQQQEALDATNPLHPNYLGDSGILKGMEWVWLRPDERYRVTKSFMLTLKQQDDKEE